MSWCVIPGKQDTHTQQKRERVTITRTSWRQQDQSSNGKYLVRKMHRTLTDNWILPMTWRKSMNHNHSASQSLNEQAKYSHERLQLNRQTNLGSSTHITQIMNYRTWYNERNITKITSNNYNDRNQEAVKGQLLCVCSGEPRFTAADKWWQKLTERRRREEKWRKAQNMI